MAMIWDGPIYFTPAPVRGRYLQGLWKSSPSTPAAPDPVATANAQGAANLTAAQQSTALSRADQITPYGTLKWTQGGDAVGFDQTGYDAALKQYQTDLDSYNANKDNVKPAVAPTYTYDGEGNPSIASNGTEGVAAPTAPTAVDRTKYVTNSDPLKWTSTIELAPEIQSLFDAQNKQSNNLVGATNTALDRTTATLAKDPTTGLPAAATAAGSQAAAAEKFGATGAQQISLPNYSSSLTDSSGDLAKSQVLAGQSGSLVGNQLNKLSNLYSTDLNYDSATAMPTADEAARKKIEDSLYANSTARLDPQYQQGQSDLDARLATQGITQGSQAWQRENQNMTMAKTDAYANARNTAVSSSTDQMQKLFDMGLASRQQGVSEANTIRNQTSLEAATAAQLNAGLQSQNQGYYGVEQGQAVADSAMEAQKAQTAIAAATAQQGINSQAAQTQAQSALAQSQVAAADYGLDSADRATAQNESAANRLQVLNELNALRTGSQATMPTFQANTGGAAVAAAPIAATTASDYNNQLSAYNAQLGSQNSMMGGLATLGAAGIAAFA